MPLPLTRLAGFFFPPTCFTFLALLFAGLFLLATPVDTKGILDASGLTRERDFGLAFGLAFLPLAACLGLGARFAGCLALRLLPGMEREALPTTAETVSAAGRAMASDFGAGPVVSSFSSTATLVNGNSVGVDGCRGGGDGVRARSDCALQSVSDSSELSDR